MLQPQFDLTSLYSPTSPGSADKSNSQKMKTTKNLIRWLLAASLLFGLFQLNAQTYHNTFDKAQSIGEGVIEVSGNYAYQSYRYDGEGNGVANTYGLRVGYGLDNHFDIKFSWTAWQWDDTEFIGDDNMNFFVFKPKYSFGEEGMVALAVPIGLRSYSYGDETENKFYLAPEVMFNYPVNEFFEAGANGRFVFPFEEKADPMIGFNVSVGVSSDLTQWVVRPELGVLFEPGEDGFYLTPGIAASYYIGGGE